MNLTVTLKNWGNSYGIRISKKEANELGLRVGDTLQAAIVKKGQLDGFGIFRGAKPFVREHQDRF